MPRWWSHYGTAILAARPRRPKDKAKVEVAVQIAQRWGLARLRNHRFFSLAELNVAIGGLVIELNARQMRGFGSSRAELFAEIDKPKLGELLAVANSFDKPIGQGGLGVSDLGASAALGALIVISIYLILQRPGRYTSRNTAPP